MLSALLRATIGAAAAAAEAAAAEAAAAEAAAAAVAAAAATAVVVLVAVALLAVALLAAALLAVAAAHFERRVPAAVVLGWVAWTQARVLARKPAYGGSPPWTPVGKGRQTD